MQNNPVFVPPLTTTQPTSLMTTTNVVPQSQNVAAQASNAFNSSVVQKGSLVSLYGHIVPPKIPVRKKPAPTPEPSVEDIAKKAKSTFIDDPVAYQILRELDVPDNFLNSGKVLSWVLEPEDPAFSKIHDYVSHGQRDGFGVKVLTALRIMCRANHLWGDVPVKEFSKDPKVVGQRRMMLWHGTKKENVAPILEFGLKLPEKINKNHIFGPGIYFSDMVCKSAKQCDSIFSAPRIGYLFLCDVLLGNSFQSLTPLRDIKMAPPTHPSWLGRITGSQPTLNQSVKGCGLREPDPKDDENIDGCVWPLGKRMITRKMKQKPLLMFNDYVVYDISKVQPQYLVKVEFTNKPFYETIK